MKNLALYALGAAALLATACDRPAKPQNLTDFCNERVASATSLEDSVIAIDGSYIGAYFNYQAQQLPVKNINKAEMLRGMRDVLATDTANVSYLYGLQMGMAVLNTYKELSEGAEISKEKFIATMSDAFRLDSVSAEQINLLQPQFEEIYSRMKELAKKRREAEVFNSEAARQNRMLAEAVGAKLQGSPEFKPAGSDGIMKHTLSEGTGEAINPNKVVTVSYTISRIDSGAEIRSENGSKMFGYRPNNEVLASVLPLMTKGEKAEFFVPYEKAYGVGGNSRLQVGPCESVMITVSIDDVAE